MDKKTKDHSQVNSIRRLICKKWSLLIIKQINVEGKLRFKELEDTLYGISPTTLTITLKELEQERFVKKLVFNEVPPRVEYSLAERGKELLQLLKQLEDWLSVN